MSENHESSSVGGLIEKWRATADKWDEIASQCVVPSDGKHFKIAANEKRLCATDLEAALTAGGWYPIKTAAKDGTRVLCYEGGSTYIAYWLTQSAGTPCWWMESNGAVQPTHWMPLPSAPTETK